MPTKEHVMVDMYAILATSKSSALAADIVQTQLNVIRNWLKNWNIKMNAEKSNRSTFSLKIGDCIDIIQKYQSKTHRLLTNAPWLMRNNAPHRALNRHLIRD